MPNGVTKPPTAARQSQRGQRTRRARARTMKVAPSTIQPGDHHRLPAAAVSTTSGVVTAPARDPMPYPAIPAATSCPGRPVSTPRMASPSAKANHQYQPTAAITMPVGDQGVGAQHLPGPARDRVRLAVLEREVSDPRHDRRGEQDGDGVGPHQRQGAVLGDHPGGDRRAGDHADPVGEVLPGQGTNSDTRPDTVSEVGKHRARRRDTHCCGCSDHQAAEAQVHDGEVVHRCPDGHVRCPSACTPSTTARARPDVSRCRSRAAHHGDVRRAMPERPGDQPRRPHRARLLQGDQGQSDFGEPEPGPADERRHQDAEHVSVHHPSMWCNAPLAGSCRIVCVGLIDCTYGLIS